MKLSEAQEARVRSYVDDHQLQLRTLSDDIIDHLCCVLEHELGKGKPFDQVLQDATVELAPHGLKDLQRKTLYLLNLKRITFMKRLTYVMGFLGSVSLTTGVTFKLLHMPGANEFFMIGYIMMLLIFVPLWAYDRFKMSGAPSTLAKWKIFLGVASSGALGMAGIFKMMHLPGANFLLLSGVFIFATGFLPFLFFNMYKESVS